MKKRLMALLLAFVMLAALLTACGKDEKDGEITHLVMAFPTWTGAPADTKLVNDAINKITREKIGVEVELQIYDSGSYKQSMTLALSGGEQVDILNCMLCGYTTFANQGYLLDLNENDLLNTHGKGIIEAMGWDYINATKVNGVQYGLPNNRDMAQGRGCMAVQTKYLEGIGYQFPNDGKEIIEISEEELCGLLAQIHEKYPNIETFRPAVNNSFAQWSTVDRLNNDVYGVLMNYGHEAKVVNLFETEEYMNYCKMMYDFNQKGYISADAATDSTAVTELVKADTLVAYHTGGKPGIKAQESGYGTPMTIFQTKENFVSSSSVAQFPWCISYTCKEPEAAMKLLNLFYTTPELCDLLCYGIKDTHYTVTESGQRTTEGVAKASDYATLPFLCPNQYLTTVSVDDNPNLWDEMRAFNNNAEQSIACGFTFDASGVATEMTACANVYAEYQQRLEMGYVDPETGIPEMNQKMLAAGLQKIIDAKQQQLDAWLAAKG